MSMDEEWAKEVSDILRKQVGDFYAEKSRARIRMDLNEYQEKALKTAVYPAG